MSAKWALRLLLVAWLVLGLAWAGLHFWIVPRIGELRPWLEQRASAALGTPVQIGGIAAISNGLIPSVELTQVRLLDPQGRDALVLPSVQAALSPHSLLRMGVEQLYIAKPVLDIRRTPDGRFWIAGMPLPEGGGDDSPALDWLFAQSELAIVGGTVQWTDELRGAPALLLQEVNLVLRNRLLSHAVRLDAQAPVAWGDRFSVSGVFREPLLARRSGQWQTWDGQVYASFPQVDLSHLRRYVDLGVDLVQGQGALRAWVDVKKGQVIGATADVQMASVQLTAGAKLPALSLRTVSGRVGAQRLEGGSEVFTQALQFETEDGVRWPGGNVLLRRWDAAGNTPARGEVVADRLDLAAIGDIAQRLPLGDALHAELKQLGARGLVEQLDGSWRGPLEQPENYALKGRVSQLTIPAQNHNKVLRPGFQGLDADFDLNQAGGKVQLVLDKGVFDALGILEDGPVFFEQLRADVAWQRQGEALTVSGSNVRFANADAQGELLFKWQSAANGPGVLDLQGSLARAEGTRVHRYLPLELDKEVRDYVRGAVLAGTATGVKFKLKGDLARFPFTDAKQGDFRISANVQNASLAYVPPSLLPKNSLPWPALEQLNGELIIDHATLQARVDRGLLAGTAIQLGKAEGLITNIYDGAQLQVAADAKGPLADVLAVVNRSPLGGLLDNVLATASATGGAEYKLKLGFPIADVDRATVSGSIALSGNDLQITSDTPRLQRARGTVAFNESSFTVAGVAARAVGGDVRIDGGLSLQAATPANRTVVPATLRVQGTATAEGLRQAKELGPLARLAGDMRGTAAYNLVLGLRSGTLEWQLNSSLVGMALALPAPFAKPAEQPLPLRLDNTAVRPAPGMASPQPLEQLRLELGRLASAVYVRDLSGTQARVVRGAIALGLADDESAPLPDEGVVANVSVAVLDADAWSKVLERVAGEGVPVGNVPTSGTSATMGYLPTVLAVRTKELTVGGRKLHNMVVGGGRDGMVWRANLDATELSGYLEYRQPSGPNAGRVYARLARLAVGQSTAQDVESLLDDQPSTIPALDIEVEDFELRGKKLGRVDLEAVNLGPTGAREWRLNRFNIQTPEATLTASGNWANLGGATAGRSLKERRRTVLNFKLDINNSGELLTRFGMPGVVRNGKGKVEGQVAWLGSPITVDYASMGGNFNVNVETGQFLKADPGIAKLLGVLSLQSLPRRLTLDFRDVFSEGFAFDYFRGDIAVEQGIAKTSNLQMKGVNAAVLMDGQADIAKETQNLRVVVVPEINAGSASLIAAAINPVVGLSTFLAQLILRGPLVNAATQEFTIDGTWVDPKVTKVERR
ncbi:YhdP family protein [Rhodoferax sp.]|uniref:YhdP family protein n=1 Tax=Rhodoferax sp. TaxID=50421 RepID=UPI002ACD61D9|nr:YhdP family protein [Rhodoferax sp.]MDZ7920942.1 YhdP family protein [Rhodoferax sp.]